MYDYFKGQIIELTPTDLVVECNNIGYHILISLQSYEVFKEQRECKVFIYHHLREDDEQLFGFATKNERELFKLLISVSGIGVGSARMMLSSLTDEEIINAIISEDVNRIKGVKGIGLKSAQKVIIELKDKLIKGGGVESSLSQPGYDSSVMEEAFAALVMLGFSKPNISKVLTVISKENPSSKVEDVIKIALQRL